MFLFTFDVFKTFFDGVQARVASGVKASEVGYQLAFSKQELRKVINQYPGSTVSSFLVLDICTQFLINYSIGKKRVGVFI